MAPIINEASSPIARLARTLFQEEEAAEDSEKLMKRSFEAGGRVQPGARWLILGSLMLAAGCLLMMGAYGGSDHLFKQVLRTGIADDPKLRSAFLRNLAAIKNGATVAALANVFIAAGLLKQRTLAVVPILLSALAIIVFVFCAGLIL